MQLTIVHSHIQRGRDEYKYKVMQKKKDTPPLMFRVCSNLECSGCSLQIRFPQMKQTHEGNKNVQQFHPRLQGQQTLLHFFNYQLHHE